MLSSIPSHHLFILCFCSTFFVSACSSKNKSATEPPNPIDTPQENQEESQEKTPKDIEVPVNSSTAPDSTDNNAPPKPPRLQNNTAKLVKEGILEKVPEQVTLGEEFVVAFRTMYPNGCWMQSEPTHKINTSSGESLTIEHTYTTTYEAEGRMCTMGFKHGGFQTTLKADVVGVYEGRISVDGKLRTTYTIEVISN